MPKNDELLDKTNLQFGKHRGKSPREIARIDPSYLVWAYANINPPPCSRDLALLCEEAPTDDPDELDSWARDIADDL